jgi:hypothetical protein
MVNLRSAHHQNRSAGPLRWCGRPGRDQAGDQGIEAGGEPFVAVIDPDVLADNGQNGKRSTASDRRNACSSRLVALSWTRCSPAEARSPSAKPIGFRRTQPSRASGANLSAYIGNGVRDSAEDRCIV